MCIGTDLQRFDKHADVHRPAKAGRSAGAGDPPTLTIGYAGSLTTNCNLSLVINTLEMLAADRLSSAASHFLVMGGGRRGTPGVRGPYTGKELDVPFTGNLPYAEIVGRLASCYIAADPLVRSFGGSLINKVCDVPASDMPAVNPQESPENRRLLERGGAGLTYAPGDVWQMAEVIRRLLESLHCASGWGWATGGWRSIYGDEPSRLHFLYEVGERCGVPRIGEARQLQVDITVRGG